MATQDDLEWQKLMTLADSLAPAVATAFLDMIAKLEARYTRAEVAEALGAGKLAEVIQDLITAPELTEFKGPLQAAILSLAERETLMLRPAIVVAFDRYNPAAVKAVQDQGAILIRAITDEMQETIRTIAADGLRTGAGTGEVAGEVRTLIGLTPRQAQSVLNYRRLLESNDSAALDRALRDHRFDPSLNRALVTGNKLSVQQIDTQVEALRQRTLTFRAQTIARNEMITALQTGQRAAWTQVLEQSDDIASVLRFWYVARDERVCPTCSPVPGMNQGGVGFDEPFRTPVGMVMGPTLHVSCRCVVFVRPTFA